MRGAYFGTADVRMGHAVLLSLIRLSWVLAVVFHIGCDDPAQSGGVIAIDDVDARPEADGAGGTVGVHDASPRPEIGVDAEVQTPSAASLQAMFYDGQRVQEMALDIEPADRQAMFDALPDRVYVPATFRWRDVELTNVGVRFKGNSSSSPDAWWKRSLLIKFGEFVDGQRFLGLRRVALDNAVQTGSVFSERLLLDVLRVEGVKCSRANYAAVTINGVFDGLFVNVERIDKSFLERVFGNRDGVLYKNHLGGAGSDLSALPRAQDYAGSFEPKTHTDEADFSEIMALAVLLRDTPDAALVAALEARFELDPFLRLMAIMVFGGAFDQYTGMGPHNYYLYGDPATGLMSYLVWDLDVGFADNAFGRVPVIDGWNASWPLMQRPRPLIERILSNDALRTRYLVHADRILETYFRPEQMGAALDALYAQAQPILDEDPYPPRRVTVQSDRGYPSIVASQKAFIQRRYQTARAQLDAPVTDGPQDRGPMPGETGPDDPTDLRVDAVDGRGVHLSWTDNSDREGLTILQRWEGEGCEGFRNHIGIEPDEPPRRVDGQVRPGVLYRYRAYAAWPTPDGPQGSGTSNVVEATP